MPNYTEKFLADLGRNNRWQNPIDEYNHPILLLPAPSQKRTIFKKRKNKKRRNK